MWPNPQETADLVTFIEEILRKTLFFVQCIWQDPKHNLFGNCERFFFTTLTP